MRCMMVNTGSCIPKISDMVLYTVCLLLTHIAYSLHDQQECQVEVGLEPEMMLK